MRGPHDGLTPIQASPHRPRFEARHTRKGTPVQSQRTRVLVEIALCVALAAVLNLWRIKLPWNIAGGDISLSMLPIFVLALRRGALPALCAGLAFGVIDYFYEPYFVAPIQLLLDYPVAYGALALAGVGSASWKRAMADGRLATGTSIAAASIALGSLGRFCSHFVSGIVFFGSNAPAGQPVAVYSALYNISYVLPSALLCGAAALIVLPALELAVPAVHVTHGAAT
jgi:thiamine transporter